jgi:hypothetical protein
MTRLPPKHPRIDEVVNASGERLWQVVYADKNGFRPSRTFRDRNAAYELYDRHLREYHGETMPTKTVEASNPKDWNWVVAPDGCPPTLHEYARMVGRFNGMGSDIVGPFGACEFNWNKHARMHITHFALDPDWLAQNPDYQGPGIVLEKGVWTPYDYARDGKPSLPSFVNVEYEREDGARFDRKAGVMTVSEWQRTVRYRADRVPGSSKGSPAQTRGYMSPETIVALGDLKAKLASIILTPTAPASIATLRECPDMIEKILGGCCPVEELTLLRDNLGREFEAKRRAVDDSFNRRHADLDVRAKKLEQEYKDHERALRLAVDHEITTKVDAEVKRRMEMLQGKTVTGGKRKMQL